jgi:heme/copper-type cytochrome/quinol oxidase subunit 2
LPHLAVNASALWDMNDNADINVVAATAAANLFLIVVLVMAISLIRLSRPAGDPSGHQPLCGLESRSLLVWVNFCLLIFWL